LRVCATKKAFQPAILVQLDPATWAGLRSAGTISASRLKTKPLR